MSTGWSQVIDILLSLECTVLLNAHRLQHIGRFERACVLCDGHVAECAECH